MLRAAAEARSTGEARTRDLVHRTGVPGFAALVAGRAAAAPREWVAVVGPGACRTVESLAGFMGPEGSGPYADASRTLWAWQS